MPLPPPIYPPVVPKGFLSEEETGIISLGAQLYAKYHPAAQQQRMYQTLLEDETFQAAEASRRLKLLTDERDRILQNLGRFREVGLGPSGRAGAGAGGTVGRGARSGARYATGGGLSSAQLNLVGAMAAVETGREIDSRKMGFDLSEDIERMYGVPGPVKDFIATVIQKAANADTSAALGFLLGEQGRAALADLSQLNLTPMQRKAAGASLYGGLAAQHYEFFVSPTTGKPTAVAVRVAGEIDKAFGGPQGTETDNFVSGAVTAGKSPSIAIEVAKGATRRDLLGGVDAGYYEELGKTLVLDANADGTVTDEEQRAFDEQKARRAALGISEPLSVEEQEFLSRYIDAMRDDGVATREELGGAYDQAKAAYDKGKMAERLPRGSAAFYDEGYLRDLGRLSTVDQQLASLEQRESPQTRAAQRTLAMKVPAEVLEATAQVSPLAAEALPYALRRVSDSGGKVSPQDDVEAFAQRVIESDPTRDFNAVVRAATKKYPNDAQARRKMLAYYGAYHYVRDQANVTFNQGSIGANPTQAIRERDVFSQKYVASQPAPAPQQQQPPQQGGLPQMPSSQIGAAYADPTLQAQIEESRGLPPGALDRFTRRVGQPPPPSQIGAAYADPAVQAQIEAERGLPPGALDMFMQRLGPAPIAPPSMAPADIVPRISPTQTWDR